MSALAQIIGWLSFGLGLIALYFGFSESAGGARMAIFFAPGLILGGVLIAVLGEIASDVRAIRDRGQPESNRPAGELSTSAAHEPGDY